MRFIMLVTILSALARGVWAIDTEHAQAYIPLISAVMEGDKDAIAVFEAELKDEPLASSISIDANLHLVECFDDFDEAPEGSIAIIPNRGIMMKRDTSLKNGTASIGRMVKRADTHPNIGAILQWVDSPGGAVDGMIVYADTIKGTKKPLVTFIDGTAASAAYCACAGSNEIIASSNTDMIGSIGTMIMIRDLQPMFEAQGVKFHEIYADGSEDKNQDRIEALKGEYKRMKDNILNPTNEQFLNTVKEYRGAVLKEYTLTGGIYIGQAAVDAGLIDSIGTFESAVARAVELAEEHKQSTGGPDSKFKITIS